MLATLAIVCGFLALLIAFWLFRKLSPHPSPAQCEALLERYVTHVAYAIDPKPAASAMAERHRLAHEAAEKNGAFAECTDVLTLDELNCGMQAESADALERCLPLR